MKIKETIERWCCDSKKDLKQYRGSYKKDSTRSNNDVYFCIHCGQLWSSRKILDVAGGYDWILEKIDI